MAGIEVTLTDIVRMFLPSVFLAGAVFAYPRLSIDAWLPDIRPDKLAAVTIGVAATALGALLAFELATFGRGDWITLLAIGFGLLGTAIAARHPRNATTGKLIIGGVGGLIAFAASNGLVIWFEAGIEQALQHSTIAVFLAVPATAMLSLGHADATGSEYATPLRAFMVVAPLGMAAILFASATPPGHGALLSITLYNTTFSGLMAIVGVVPYWVGTCLGGRPGPR